ncbi:hypothetical protein HNQ94_000302 [Salirhabdus euzebyi]|uniref:Uncharacterized protein n=1 Tax=Salirhabdus euzebyi TaxID=394506 RepID=A0A841PYA2_9BACI|nr:hypothetical protein [Salirhabdus euzebyi]
MKEKVVKHTVNREEMSRLKTFLHTILMKDVLEVPHRTGYLVDVGRKQALLYRVEVH